MRIVLDLQSCQTEGSKNRGIGRYSIALAEAMLRRGGHEFFVVLNGAFPEAAAAVRERLRDLLPSDHIRTFDIAEGRGEPAPQGSWRSEMNLRLHDDFIAALRPDAVHVTSLFEGLNDEAVTDLPPQGDGILRAVTLYDLIPFINPDPYLVAPQVRRWYYRRLQSLKRADLLLAISSSSRMEAIDRLGLPGERVVNISSAIDPAFVPMQVSAGDAASLKRRMGITDRFVMYTGGIDHRKNLKGLIEAYALLSPDLRRRRQLAIVCSINEPQREVLRTVAVKCGLQRDELVLTGYVSEADLIALYNSCELFVFPSLHEGFGLPALEAMTCGAPTIGSNNSSIPEVIGYPEALFDAADAVAIADKMTRVLTNPGFADALRRHGLKQSRRFHWDKSAECAIQAIEHAKAALIPGALVNRPLRPRLALVSPFPPLESGIAKYAIDMLPELSRYYDVDLVVDQEKIDGEWALANCDIITVDEFKKRKPSNFYQRIVYQFGNSHFHAHMPDLLQQHPGVVVLHDLYLSGMQNWRQATRAPGVFFSALIETHGYNAIRAFVRNGVGDVIRHYPANGPVVEGAVGLIVHSRSNLAYLEQIGIDPTFLTRVRLPRNRPTISREGARALLGVASNEIMICSFGGVAPTKLNHELLAAFTRAKTLRSGPVKLVFVGSAEGDYGQALIDRIHAEELKSQVEVTGYVDEQTYQTYLAAADIAVQLRTGSRGETSAAALDALNNGLALIVNAHGTMAELERDAVVMLDDEVDIDALSGALTRLVDDGDQRHRLARAARATMAGHSATTAGDTYHEAIEFFYDRHPRARQQRLVQEAVAEGRRAAPLRDDIAQFVAASGRNADIIGRDKLFVDVSALVADENRSRARWVRQALDALVFADGGQAVEPVYMANGEAFFRAARSFMLARLGCSVDGIEDVPVRPVQGDRFIGLDPSTCSLSSIGAQTLFRQWRGHGVTVLHLLHAEDLAGIVEDGVVADGEGVAGRLTWLRGMAEGADELITWSHDTANAARLVFDTIGHGRRRPFAIGYPDVAIADEASDGLPVADRRLEWTPAPAHWLHGSDDRLHTIVGERADEGIRTSGSAGVLVFGPYLPFAAGAYELRVWGRIDGVGADRVHVEIHCDRGATKVARTELSVASTGPVLTTLSFTLDADCRDLELLVIVGASTAMTFAGMDIRSGDALDAAG